MSSIYARDFRVAGDSLDMKNVPRTISRPRFLCVDRPFEGKDPLSVRAEAGYSLLIRYPDPLPHLLAV